MFNDEFYGLCGGTGIHWPSYGRSHGKPGMEGTWRRYQRPNSREGGPSGKCILPSRTWMVWFKKWYPPADFVPVTFLFPPTCSS